MKVAGKSYDSIINLKNLNSSHTQAMLFLREHSQRLGSVPLRVLEVGCSGGQFSRLLRVEGHYVFGVEPFTSIALEKKYVDDLFFGTVEDFLESECCKTAQPFDAIICGDVLEHLQNPGAVLARVGCCLAENGVIIASVPNVTHKAIQAMIRDGLWQYQSYGLLDSTHIHLFSSHSLRKTFSQAGYGIERSYNVLGHGYREYAPVFLDTNEAAAGGAHADVYQFVVRASRAALKDHIYLEDLPRNILAVTPANSSPQVQVRLLQPLQRYAKAVGGAVRFSSENIQADVQWADVLVVYCQCTPEMMGTVREAQRAGVAVVYDYDVTEPIIDNYNQSFSYYLLSATDAVTSSMQDALSVFAGFGPSVHKVNTCLPEQPEAFLQNRHTGSGRCTLVVAGCREEGVPQFYAALKRFIVAHPQHTVIGIGAVRHTMQDIGIPAKYYPVMPAEDFSELLLSLENPVGVLSREHQESRCLVKSKVDHFTSCGAVCLASHVQAYKEIITDGVTGKLVRNTPKCWLNALEDITGDSAKRQTLLTAALQAKKEYDAVNDPVEVWKKVFHRLPKPFSLV